MNSKEYRASDGTVFTNLDEYRKVRRRRRREGGREGDALGGLSASSGIGGREEEREDV